MAAELKALGRFISNDLLVQYVMASLPENYNKRAQNVDTPVKYKFCESLHQVQKKSNKVVSYAFLS
jgi:phage-related tail protein